MEKSKKLCVVGYGNWGKNHVRTLDMLGSLGGIVESDRGLINQAKSKYPYLNVYNLLDDALKNDFDGYVICTQPAYHYELAKIIIESGKPVLVEKPLTLNSRDAIELNELAKKNGVNLMVGHLLLFHPAFLKIKEMLERNILGEIQYIYSNRLNLGTFRSDENVFWSFAPHDIALFNYFFEQNPIDIVSDGVAILQEGIHDTTITSFKYNNNRMGHIFVSWLHPFKEHRFVLIGTKGMIHFNDSIEKKPLLYYDKGVKYKRGMPFPIKGCVEEITYKREKPLENELKYFIENLDKKIDIADGNSAVKVIEVLEKASEQLTKNLK